MVTKIEDYNIVSFSISFLKHIYISMEDVIGPKISPAALSTSFGEVMDKVYHSNNFFNISAIQIFIRKININV